MKKESLLGIPIAVGDKTSLLSAAERLIGVGGRIYTVNPLMLAAAMQDVCVHEVLCRATLCIPDGVGVRRAFSERGISTEVLCGVDLGELLLRQGGTVGFVGGAGDVCVRAFARLSSKYPTLRAAFLLDGYTFDEAAVTSLLRIYRPTFLFVCLGTPRQELLIDTWSRASPTTVCVGLGGSFDVYAGDVRRAPTVLRRSGLEWMWRMLCQPRRIARLPAIARYIYECRKEKKQIKCTKTIRPASKI